MLIGYDAADAFKRAGIDNPAGHYRGKSIRVTGKLVAEEGQVRMHVTDP